MKINVLIREIFKGVKKYYFTAIICSGLAVLSYSLLPLIIKLAVDSIVGNLPIENSHPLMNWFYSYLTGDKQNDLILCSIFFASIVVTSAIFEYFQSLFSVIYAQKLSKGLRDKLHNHILRLPNATLGKTQTGDLIQRCTSDVEMIAVFFSNQFIKIFKTVLLIGIVLYFMLGLNKVMTGISMAAVPFLFAYCIFFFVRVSRYFEKVEKSESAMNSVLQENLTGVRVVKAFARQKYEINKFSSVNSDLKNKHFSVIRAFGEFWTVTECFSVLQMSLVVILGSFLALDGVIAVGVLVAFISYAGEVLWPVKELSMVLAEAGRVKISLKRIAEILRHKQEEIVESEKLRPEIDGSIEFINVSFKYGKISVLKDLSFKVKSGESLGILGETGSGKTTMVHLLHRIYDNYEGQILIDGVDIKQIDRSYLRNNLSLILQESYLFSRSIKDNISFAKSNASYSEIELAADKASIHKSIKEFDQSYDTLVGESGVTLSGGQKQRMSIARSMILENPVVIFDDSLSAVDTATDRRIRERIKMDNPTSLIISHRISTLKECDHILVLEKGEITAFGTHEEIKGKDSLYKRILDIQNEVKDSFHMSLEETITCLAE